MEIFIQFSKLRHPKTLQNVYILIFLNGRKVKYATDLQG